MGSIQLRRERTNGAALLQSSLEPLARQCAEQEIELRVVSDTDVPDIVVDPEKVAWAISVIVGNALRYLRRGSEEGGSILVHLTTQDGGREVAIAVQDDGPGIPKDKLPSLLQRAPGEKHAPGLALSLVSEIVQAHGGRVTLDSRSEAEEHFTCVTLILPKRPPEH